MNDSLTDHIGGIAWSEDPRGYELSALRIDVEGAQAHSLSIPRRGAIRLTHGGDPQTLGAIRERVLEAELELGGPVALRWRSYGGNVDTYDTRLIDEPLPWGGGPGRGMPHTPHPFDRWSRANAGEVIPNVMTPFSWSIISDALDSGFHAPWGDWTSGRRFVALYDGYAYFNVGLMLELLQQRLGLSGTHFLEAVGGPEAAAFARSDPDDPASTRIRWGTMLRHLPMMLRMLRQQGELPKRWPQERAIAEAERDRLKALDLDALTERELTRELTRSAAHGERQTIFLMEAQAAVFGAVQGLLWATDRWLGANQRNLTLSVLQGLPGVRTQEGNLALRRIAERAAAESDAVTFVRSHEASDLWPSVHADELPESLAWLRDALDDFMTEYGHRAAGELEMAEPRWVERPALILETFREYVLNPERNSVDQIVGRQHSARMEAQREIRERLYQHPFGWARWPLFRAQLRYARRLQPLRENPKFTLLELSLQQRRLWRKLGARWVRSGALRQADDIYYLFFDELASLARRSNDPLVAARLRSRAQRRRQQFNEWRQSPAPPLRDLHGQLIELESMPDEAPDAASEESVPADKSGSALPLTLRGIAASNGAVEGRAHVANSPEIGRELTPGQILVARFTDPGWTPIFPLAAAVVTEIGGVLSHGAIVAREFGIPAVVNVQRATQQIHSGDLLQVDGSNGRVTILERG